MEVTGVVLAVKVAEVWPAGTTTEAGIVTGDLAGTERYTVPPFAIAGPFSTTVPVDEPPPVTAVGLKLNDMSARGMMVKEAVFETLP
jgi:hypothetical protein